MNKYFVDMDGTLAEWRAKASEKDLYRKGYFASLRPNEALVQKINRMHKAGESICILSSVLTDSAHAVREKFQWAERFLPGIPVVLVPYGNSKADVVREYSGRGELDKTFVLIDDHSPNLFAWEKRGGRAIKFLNGINGKGASGWNGERMSEA